MKSHSTFRATLALAAFALGVSGAVAAQSPDIAAPAAPITTETATTPVELAADLNAPIGSTNVMRNDSANAAFKKLDRQNSGFVSRMDLAQLPGFGNAFAQADRDGDGRLDRTEFVDAWTAYTGQDAGATGASSNTSASSSSMSQ